MKRTLPILAAALALAFTGCSWLTPANVTTTAATASVDISLIPAPLVDGVKKLVAAHPSALPWLTSIANGLESVSADGAKLPAPDSASITLLSWIGGNIPGAGQFVADFVNLYRLWYSTLAPTSKVTVQLAELLRSLQPVNSTPAP